MWTKKITTLQLATFGLHMLFNNKRKQHKHLCKQITIGGIGAYEIITFLIIQFTDTSKLFITNLVLSDDKVNLYFEVLAASTSYAVFQCNALHSSWFNKQYLWLFLPWPNVISWGNRLFYFSVRWKPYSITMTKKKSYQSLKSRRRYLRVGCKRYRLPRLKTKKKWL